MNVKRIIAVLAITMVFFACTGTLLAEEGRFELNDSYGMKDLLTSYTGKRVSVKVDGGEALEGTITKVGSHLVHLSKLSGKDFYDAVVVIDRINAVVLRVRGN